MWAVVYSLIGQLARGQWSALWLVRWQGGSRSCHWRRPDIWTEAKAARLLCSGFGSLWLSDLCPDPPLSGQAAGGRQPGADRPERGGCHGDPAGRLQPGGERAARAPGSGGGGFVPAGAVAQPLLCRSVPLLWGRPRGHLTDAVSGPAKPARGASAGGAVAAARRRPGLQRGAEPLWAEGGCEGHVPVAWRPWHTERNPWHTERKTKSAPSRDGGVFCCRCGAGSWGHSDTRSASCFDSGTLPLQGRAGIRTGPWHQVNSPVLTVDGLWRCVICVNTWQKWAVTCSGWWIKARAPAIRRSVTRL